MYVIGLLAGVLYGYPIVDSMFESASVTGNVGLSCGITSASMPAGLKILFMGMMWVGRLEFLSVFILIGFIAKGARKLWRA